MYSLIIKLFMQIIILSNDVLQFYRNNGNYLITISKATIFYSEVIKTMDGL